ncbi:MAG: hypothetical protein KDF60_02075 [Calditrichaeota bacterium]|nr:hypothetical protein [Calditrichota bacterium]
MKNRISIFILYCFLAACSTETSINQPDTNEQTASFSFIEKNVFRTRCAFSGCHASDTKSANLDLSTTNAYSNLVNVKSILSTEGLNRVEPGNSQTSFLIKVLDGSNPTKMPLNGAPLDQETIDLIAKWIDEGAQNN